MYSEADSGWAVKTLPLELRLLIDCCRANFARRGSERFVQSYTAVDWERFSSLAKRHRVEGLAWHGLRTLALHPPKDFATQLLSISRQIAQDGLRVAFASERLRSEFASRNMPLLFLKGLSVGHLAYGDAFRKSAADLDILVSPDQIAQAAALLRELGYQAVSPACDSDDIIRRWHRVSKESTWLDHEANHCLELHSALTDHQDLLIGLGTGSPVQQVMVMPGVTIGTFATDELVAYLCVHGASSAWFRLKWIADLAGLLAGATEEELSRLLGRARLLGAGRAAEQAFLLICFLFPLLPEDAPLARALQRDRTAMWLARRSLAQLLASEPTARPLGTLTIHLTQLMLGQGRRSAWREFRRQITQRWQTNSFPNAA